MPLDLFSELRPVTSLLVQLQVAADMDTEALHTILNNASRMMLEVLHPHQGKINKILLFDKVRGWAVSKRERLRALRHRSKTCCICPWQGCMVLCVFGLSGEKLLYESIHALQSAVQIFNSCSALLGEKE